MVSVLKGFFLSLGHFSLYLWFSLFHFFFLYFFFISYSSFDLLFSSLNQSNLFSQLNLHFFSFFFSSHLSSLFFLFFCFFFSCFFYFFFLFLAQSCSFLGSNSFFLFSLSLNIFSFYLGTPCFILPLFIGNNKTPGTFLDGIIMVIIFLGLSQPFITVAHFIQVCLCWHLHNNYVMV